MFIGSKAGTVGAARPMTKASVTITLKEFEFLRAYIEIDSPTFANAYQSCMKAGYSKSYCRVIRRNYPVLRMKWLKKALKDGGLVRVIEATRNVDFGTPIANSEEIRRIIRERQRKLIGMTAEEVISALDKLLGKPI